MTAHDLFFPALAQVGLTLILLVWMGRVRLRSLSQEKVRVSQIALGQRAWPERVQRISNAFHNQLELPILFYATVLFALQFGYAGTVFVTLAWIFVAFRLLHAFIQTTGRNIRFRFASFVCGVAVLAVMWALLTVHIVRTMPTDIAV